MAIADYLEKIGEGAKKVGKVAGAVAEPLGKSVAETLSGEAPQIHAEKRQHAQQLSDEQRQNEINDLEKQLDEGRKYGTLTTEQQKQYTDAIARHYSDPSQMGTLIQKLHKAIHPNGAVRQSAAPLPNVIPEGGTAKQDEQNRQKALVDALGLRQATTDEEIDRRAQDAQKYHKPAGKSPPTPGNQIPQDAIGPDGQVIPSALRTPGQSFIEWNGAWYPAPKAKPIYKVIKGNVVLMDPATGAPMRDLGPAAGVKMSSHQTPFLGDDGQMHLLTTTSVSTPQGETVEVEAPPPEAPGEAGTTPAAPAAPPKEKVGTLLPRTGAKPAQPARSGGAGPVIAGSHAWAASKNPLYKSDMAQYTKVAEDANVKAEAYKSASAALAAGSTASSDQELIYQWVRSNVQGAGRMTQAEFRQAASTGSLPLQAQSAWQKATTGKLPPELEKMFVADIKRAADTSVQEAADLRKRVEQPGNAPSSGSGQVENWVRDPKTGKLVKQ
jgi:hypothetical protein